MAIDKEYENIGGCCVRLRNRFRVDRSLIDDAFREHPLTSDKDQLLLVIDDEDDPSCEDYRALAIHSSVLDQQGGVVPIIPRKRIFLEQEDSKAYSRKNWDTAVYIPKSTAEKAKDYPEYFAFVLAHELEHVRVYRSDIVLSMCLAWLYDNGGELFVTSEGEGLFKKWDIPHELQCYKMGKKVAVEIYGEETFNTCLEKLKKVESNEHREVLEFVKSLEMDPHMEDLAEHLSKDLIDFLKKYSCKLGS